MHTRLKQTGMGLGHESANRHWDWIWSLLAPTDLERLGGGRRLMDIGARH